MSSAEKYPLTTAIVQGIRKHSGGEGLDMLAQETVCSVLGALENAGFTIIQGPLPIEEADKSRRILAYFGKGRERGLYTATWNDERHHNKPLPHWKPRGCAWGVKWERSNQPTHFWYPPEA